MRPIRLTLSAFGPYADKQILDFNELGDRSFFLIHGPTGAGKTSILDGICFALYGDASGTTRTSKSMRSDHADLTVPTEVEFEFSIGMDAYRVKRWPEQERPRKRGSGTTLESAGAELYSLNSEGEAEILATGWSHVTQKVETLLGFKSEQFRQVVLLPQGDFRKLLTATSNERQEIMQTLFKTDLYKMIEDKLKAKAQDLKKQYDQYAHERSILLQEASVSTLNELELRIHEREKQTQEITLKVEELNKKLRAAQDELSKARQTMEHFQEHDSAQKSLADLQAKIPEVEKFRKGLEKALSANQLNEAEENLLRLRAEVDELAKIKQQQITALSQAEKRLASTQKTLKEQEAKAPERDAALTEVHRLEQLTETVQALAQATQEANAAQKVLERALTHKNQTKEQLEQTQAQIQVKTAEQQSLLLLAAEAGQRRLLFEKMKETVNQRKSLEEATKQLTEAERRAHATKRQLDNFEQKVHTCKAELTNLQEAWINGQAGLMAAQLSPGSPCPVCGSIHHPQPATLPEQTPAEKTVKEKQKELETLEKALEKARELWNTQTKERDRLAQTVEYLNEQLGDYTSLSLAALEKKLNQAQKTYEEALQAESQSKAYLSLLEKLQTQVSTLQKELEEAESTWLKANSAYNTAMAIVQERQTQVPSELRDPAALAKAYRKALDLQARLKKEYESAQQEYQKAMQEHSSQKSNVLNAQNNWELAEKRLSTAQTEFKQRVEQAGFLSLEEYTHSKWPVKRINEVQERIKNFELNLNAALERAERAKEKIKDLTLPDLSVYQEVVDRVKAEYDQSLREQATLSHLFEREKHWFHRLTELHQQMDALSSRYAVTGRLSEVANGTNEYRLTFQRFVLGALLDDVALAANERLKTMSRGRYFLQRTLDRARKNMAGGLDLEVFDNYTGYARAVGTLSGGETFLASLSLALGLVDVVQAYAGGIHLDTLFVDEGFGTLDPESLDFAIKALIDLQQGGRLVGIISHVPELKERIDARLEVTPTSKGSIASFKVG